MFRLEIYMALYIKRRYDCTKVDNKKKKTKKNFIFHQIFKNRFAK